MEILAVTVSKCVCVGEHIDLYVTCHSVFLVYNLGISFLPTVENEISKYLAYTINVTSFHLSPGSQSDNHHSSPLSIQS